MDVSSRTGVLDDDERTSAGESWRLVRAYRVDEEVLARGTGKYTGMGDNKEMAEVIRRAIEGWRNFYSSELEEIRQGVLSQPIGPASKINKKGVTLRLRRPLRPSQRISAKTMMNEM